MQDENYADGCGGVLFAILLVGSSFFLPVGAGILITLGVGAVVVGLSLFGKGDGQFFTMFCGGAVVQYGILYLNVRDMELDTLAGDGFGISVCVLIMLIAGAMALKGENR